MDAVNGVFFCFFCYVTLALVCSAGMQKVPGSMPTIGTFFPFPFRFCAGSANAGGHRFESTFFPSF